MTKWIKVQERMPRTKGQYLTYLPKSKNKIQINECIGEDNDMIFINANSAHAKYVTHWAQLPKYPEVTE